MSVLDLEHDGNEWVPAMAPLGKDPDHCGRCRDVAELNRRRATCTHPDEHVNRIEITSLGGPKHVLVHCGWCMSSLEDR